MKGKRIELGGNVRDRMRDSSGIAIARKEYLQRETRILISQLKDDGSVDEHWVDESFVEYVDEPEVIRKGES